jgi:hypothetical protein
MSPLAGVLADAGGLAAPRAQGARLRRMLLEELTRGRRELERPRSGYGAPVEVAVAVTVGDVMGVAPVEADARADPGRLGEREWLVVAALTGALVEVSGLPRPAGPADLRLRVGDLEDRLVLSLPAEPGEGPVLAELAAEAFDEQVAGVDRLRARALAVPAFVLEGIGDLRAPIGSTHPLRVAEAVARLGGRPADQGSVGQLEDAVLALLAPRPAVSRPHRDPSQSRRVARRILQRLDGMGKWGGYHTEFAHLARGFAGHDRALAGAVGEALLEAGLLAEKPSVGQRHVFLNPRRAADIRALIEEGRVPPGVDLPPAGDPPRRIRARRAPR